MAWGAAGFDVVLVPPSNGSSANHVLPVILDLAPDVVVLDLHLGSGVNGAALLPALSGAGHRVMVLTGSHDRLRWGAALAAGATDVVSKSASLSELTESLRRVQSGRPVIPPPLRAELIHQWQAYKESRAATPSALERLSARERQVLTELATGRLVREIAERLFLSEATVRSHVKAILSKLGVRSQIAAVAVLNQAQRPHLHY